MRRGDILSGEVEVVFGIYAVACVGRRGRDDHRILVVSCRLIVDHCARPGD